MGLFFAKESFVLRHQNAVVYGGLFLAVMMLIASMILILTQHISIVQVVYLVILFSSCM